MLASGNSSVATCAKNLLTLQEGEVHLDQQRGIDATIVDAPASTALVNLQASAFRTLEVYEPRLDFDNIALTLNNHEGDFTATANTNN